MRRHFSSRAASSARQVLSTAARVRGPRPEPRGLCSRPHCPRSGAHRLCAGTDGPRATAQRSLFRCHCTRWASVCRVQGSVDCVRRRAGRAQRLVVRDESHVARVPRRADSSLDPMDRGQRLMDRDQRAVVPDPRLTDRVQRLSDRGQCFADRVTRRADRTQWPVVRSQCFNVRVQRRVDRGLWLSGRVRRHADTVNGSLFAVNGPLFVVNGSLTAVNVIQIVTAGPGPTKPAPRKRGLGSAGSIAWLHGEV